MGFLTDLSGPMRPRFLILTPGCVLLGFITLLLAVPVCIGTFRYSNNIKKLLPVMAMNVIINIATPILMGVGLFIQ